MLLLALAHAAPVAAQATAAEAPLTARVEDQARRLAEQEDEIQRQASQLEEQKRRLDAQEAFIHRYFGDPDLADLRGGAEAAQAQAQPPATVVEGAPPAATSTAPPPSTAASAAPPAGPVGQAPAPAPVRVEASALPQEATVLTRPGALVLEPNAEYTQTTTNRLVFQGVELVPGLNLGAIEATGTRRSITVAELSARYGLTPRTEVEIRVPYLWRSDHIETVEQRDQQVTRAIDLHKAGLGDVEFAARYEINAPRGSTPVFVAGLRVKSDTGGNPYLVPRDSFGVARALATGSGFWGVEPSISVLVPSDPAVIYGSIAYFKQFQKDMNADVGGVHIGLVHPGASIGIGAGFGIALNDRFSFSLGYKHSYIFSSTTTLTSTTGNITSTSKQGSGALQVGVLQFGASYVTSRRTVVGASFEFGITSDAPNVHITLRAPTSF